MKFSTTLHDITDRQTDRRQYHASSRLYCVVVLSTNELNGHYL